MAALIQSRKTPKLGQDVHPAYPTTAGVPMEAATRCYAGGIVCRNAAGNAVPGSATAGLVALGVAEKDVDNSAGIAGALYVVPRQGAFKFNNSGGPDAIAALNVGQDCYIVDDNTVALTSGMGARPRAGTIIAVDADGGVWVQFIVGSGAVVVAPVAQFLKAADAAAATATAETAFFRAPSALTITSAYFLPSAALVADAANQAVLTLSKRSGGGAAQVIASIVTNIAQGGFAAWTPATLGALAAAISSLLPGDILTFSITKNGTGVVVPAGALVVTYSPN